MASISIQLGSGPGRNPSSRAPAPHVLPPPPHHVFVNTLASFRPEKVFKCVIYFSNHDNCYKINKSLEKLPLGGCLVSDTVGVGRRHMMTRAESLTDALKWGLRSLRAATSGLLGPRRPRGGLKGKGPGSGREGAATRPWPDVQLQLGALQTGQKTEAKAQTNGVG